jgi:hypothetical protein
MVVSYHFRPDSVKPSSVSFLKLTENSFANVS